MYEVISCAKETKLHSFPNFENRCSIPNVNSHDSDCQFFPGTKMFLRTSKNRGAELMRVRHVDGISSTISSVRKFTIANLYCAACPNNDTEEIAFGLTSGVIRLTTYKKSPKVSRLEADKIANGVTFLDFSATDDFLAAVYESGTVNLYGMKT